MNSKDDRRRRRKEKRATEGRQSTNALPPNLPNLISQVWYRREEWDQIRDCSADKDHMEINFDDWKRRAEKVGKDFKREGRQVIRTEIDVDGLIAWATTQGRKIDGHTRSEYAQYLQMQKMKAKVENAPPPVRISMNAWAAERDRKLIEFAQSNDPNDGVSVRAFAEKLAREAGEASIRDIFASLKGAGVGNPDPNSAPPPPNEGFVRRQADVLIRRVYEAFEAVGKRPGN